VSRTGNRAQAARLRAREARLALLVDRNAQDERIEDAVAAVLLAWEARTAAAVQVEQAEGDVATGLRSPAAGDGSREPAAGSRGDAHAAG